MYEQEAAFYMLQELREQKLEVIIKKPRRVVISQNPEWYRRFCNTFKVARKKRPKPRTIIKRCHTVKALLRIVNKQTKGTIYEDRLQPFLESYKWQRS